MRFYFLLASLIISVISCSRNYPVTVPKIPEDRFVDYYTSTLVVTQEEKLAGHDSLQVRHRIDSLQQRYQLNPDDIAQTIGYYHSDLNRWKALNLKIIKKLEDLQKKNE